MNDSMNIRTILEAFARELRNQRDYHKEMHAVKAKAVKAADDLIKCVDKIADIKEGLK